jgi:hypothetical protein
MVEIPDPDSIPGVADWVELSICSTGSGISKAALASAIEGAAGEEPSEAFLTSIWRALDYRQELYLRRFFKVEERTVQPQSDSQPLSEYLACLLLSLFGVQGDTQLPGKLFERLTCEAVGRYLSGRGAVFGWPHDSHDGTVDEGESKIKRKIEKLADELNERFCEAPAARFNDRGLDVVGWIPFSDKRSGQVVVLLQCAAGHNWRNKLPVPLDAWLQYVHWACNPLKAFAVPCVVDERDWHEMSKDKGMLFDRVRILNLLFDGVKDRALCNELDSWVTNQLADLNV